MSSSTNPDAVVRPDVSEKDARRLASEKYIADLEALIAVERAKLAESDTHHGE